MIYHFFQNVAPYILTRASLIFVVLLAIRMVVVTAIERSRPAYRVSYLSAIARDIVPTFLVFWVLSPMAGWLDMWVQIAPTLPAAVASLALGWRIVLYVLIADFGAYWAHRLMHTKWVWRIHRWHHSPTYMYWLAGVRGSLFQFALTNAPYIYAEPLINVSPPWMAFAIMLKNTVTNDWMHLNVNWGSTWAEWLFVTPRYHHVHHSDDPKYHRANLGVLFTIWDRIFGTYVEPEPIAHKLTFGIGERVSFIRLAIGF